MSAATSEVLNERIDAADAAWKALEERIAALEARVAATKAAIETDGLVPLAHEVQRAHARLDVAARAFKQILPRQEPARIAPAHWQRALNDLRDEAAEAGSQQTFFGRDAILQRHKVLETMEANRRAAGETA